MGRRPVSEGGEPFGHLLDRSRELRRDRNHVPRAERVRDPPHLLLGLASLRNTLLVVVGPVAQDLELRHLDAVALQDPPQLGVARTRGERSRMVAWSQADAGAPRCSCCGDTLVERVGGDRLGAEDQVVAAERHERSYRDLPFVVKCEA